MFKIILILIIFIYHKCSAVGTDRIINGVDTAIEQIPYQASMWNKEHFCGCVLISPKWALTAAHCIPGIGPGDKVNFMVRIGSSYSNIGGQLVAVEEAIPHYSYWAPMENQYDIAVLKLKAFDMTNIHFATLPKCNMPEMKAKNVLVLSGWGLTNKMDNQHILQSVRLPFIPVNKCKQIFNDEPLFELHSTQRCAGLKNGGKDACLGDSGGPVTHKGVLVGIISAGFGCAEKNSPGFFTYILDEEVLEFIEETTGISCRK